MLVNLRPFIFITTLPNNFFEDSRDLL